MSRKTINENTMTFYNKEIFNIVCNGNNGNKEKKMKLIISYNDKIIYFKIEEEYIPKFEFSLNQSLEELIKKDKYFKQFNSVKEVFESLKNLIIKNKVSITKEENKSIINILHPTLDKNYIYINIPLKEKDIKSEINSLVSYIVDLNNKVNNLETQIKKLKTDFDKKLENIEQKSQEEINNIKKELNILKGNNRMFKASKIINLDEEDLILSWFDAKPISFNLLLNAEINDEFLKNFFEKCENKSPTMIFIKTTENKRFGGYTNEIWPREGAKKDEGSFIFSLTQRKKYTIKDSENAIGVLKDNWISFGNGNDLYLYNCLKSKGGGCHSYCYNLNGNDLNGEEKNFHLLNCEVYEVDI